MAKSQFDPKIAFGDISRIQTAIENGVLDQRDLVISGLATYPELYIINDNMEAKKIRPHIDTFQSVTAANAWINDASEEVFDGMPIAILNSDQTRYKLYLVKITNGSIGLNPVVTLSDLVDGDVDDSVMSIVEEVQRQLNEHLNNKSNPHEVTLEQVGLEAMTSSEIIDIVNNIFN